MSTRPARAAAGPARWVQVVARWWTAHVVSNVDHAAVVRRVDEDSGWSPRYLFMLLMSAGIAVLGLLLSSPAVVIGAMLISPLMGPIIGLGFSLTIFELREMRRSLSALALGTAVAVLFCAFVVSLSPLQSVTPEIAARTRPNLFDLLVAIFSALAGTYAVIRGRGETIVGVAIATALMPPLAVVGYGLATFNLTVFLGAGALFMTNLIAIALSAAAMAKLYGFGAHLSPKHGQFQTALIVGTFLLLSVPLALSLRHIAWEALTVRQVRQALDSYFGSDGRISQLEVEFASQPITVRAVALTRDFRPTASRDVTRTLVSRLEQPVRLQLNQILVDQDLSAREKEREAIEQSKPAPVDPAVALAEIEAGDIAVQLATLAGGNVADVVVDRGARQASVLARAIPGTPITAWRVLESRIQRSYPDWTIEVIPPPSTDLPLIPFPPGEAEPNERTIQTVETTAWALRRWNVDRVEAIGRAASLNDGARAGARALGLDRAERVAALFGERGIRAIPSVDPIGPIQRAAERDRGVERFRSVEIVLLPSDELAATQGATADQ